MRYNRKEIDAQKKKSFRYSRKSPAPELKAEEPKLPDNMITTPFPSEHKVVRKRKLKIKVKDNVKEPEANPEPEKPKNENTNSKEAQVEEFKKKIKEILKQ